MTARRLRELESLDGRVALVTGAAGHLGSALVEVLAELHATVTILDLDPSACRALADRITAEYDVEALPLAVDLLDTSGVRSVPETILDRFGRLDVLVNCAAMVNTAGLKGWVAPFGEQGIEPWRAALEINLTAPFALIQACAEPLGESGHGSIVNVGSIYGLIGPDMRLYEDTDMGNAAAYAASKGGLVQFTRWLATVLAPNIRVNAISPGGIQRGQPEAFRRRYETRTPLRRMAIEEDLKGALAFLATDLSAYVTGQNIVVDGGFTAW
jgi:NAD(P)-dependent dehydrogenase (short-subunit alcohol dehydrogenase family)